MSDRTVHASTQQMNVVRYDRAGKWYLEPTDTTLPRQAVTVGDAARYVVWALDQDHSTKLFTNRPGGKRFDVLVLLTTSGNHDKVIT